MDGITLKPPLLRLPLEGKEEDGSSIWAQTGISFRGPVGFDSVCFGDVQARVVGSADLARKWSVVVTRRGDTVRTGCCKWEAMRWLLFVCLFFFTSGVFRWDADTRASRSFFSGGYYRRRCVLLSCVCVKHRGAQSFFYLQFQSGSIFCIPGEAALTFAQFHHTILCVYRHKSQALTWMWMERERARESEELQ